MINPKMTPVANLGDLVNIAGYANRLFRVDSYTHEFTFERGIEAEDIYYDCSCVSTTEYMLGAQEDIIVVCPAVQADEFLRTYEHPEIEQIMSGLFTDWSQWTEVSAVVQPLKPVRAEVKPKEPTKEERIDALLDDMIDVNTVIEIVGDEDGVYADRLSDIKTELEAMSV